MGCINSTAAKKPVIEPRKPVIRAGAPELKMLYNIGKVLGSGSFGKVFLGENKADTEMKVAIKVISKSKLS
jgi:serine/threonine protein kinase